MYPTLLPANPQLQLSSSTSPAHPPLDPCPFPAQLHEQHHLSHDDRRDTKSAPLRHEPCLLPAPDCAPLCRAARPRVRALWRGRCYWMIFESTSLPTPMPLLSLLHPRPPPPPTLTPTPKPPISTPTIKLQTQTRQQTPTRPSASQPRPRPCPDSTWRPPRPTRSVATLSSRAIPS